MAKTGDLHDLTVLFSNNYDMTAARRGWELGLYPDHHLYGTNRPSPGTTVVDLAGMSAGLRQRFGKFGDIRQQAKALGHPRRNAVIFAANFQAVRALGLLRASHLLRHPLVGIVHAPPKSNVDIQLRALTGCDHLITKSTWTRDVLVELGIDPDRITTVHWGPDPAFDPFLTAPPPGVSDPVLSTGKSGRDIETLIEALRQSGHPAQVYVQNPQALNSPDRVSLIRAEPPQRARNAPSTYDHVINELRAASVVVVPLTNPVPFQGLTELNDALACGRPVVMTRVPYIDIDIEAEGVGIWVDPGDAFGMANALDSILGDPARLSAMSARARALVQERWNSHNFGEAAWDVLLDVSMRAR